MQDSVRIDEISLCESIIAVVDAPLPEIVLQEIDDRGNMMHSDIQGIHILSIARIGGKIKTFMLG